MLCGCVLYKFPNDTDPDIDVPAILHVTGGCLLQCYVDAEKRHADLLPRDRLSPRPIADTLITTITCGALRKIVGTSTVESIVLVKSIGRK